MTHSVDTNLFVFCSSSWSCSHWCGLHIQMNMDNNNIANSAKIVTYLIFYNVQVTANFVLWKHAIHTYKYCITCWYWMMFCTHIFFYDHKTLIRWSPNLQSWPALSPVLNHMYPGFKMFLYSCVQSDCERTFCVFNLCKHTVQLNSVTSRSPHDSKENTFD